MLAQVCAEVAIVVLDENTPVSRSWFTWRDILHLVDIICCCAVLFPIVWSIKHLREASQVLRPPFVTRVHPAPNRSSGCSGCGGCKNASRRQQPSASGQRAQYIQGLIP